VSKLRVSKSGVGLVYVPRALTLATHLTTDGKHGESNDFSTVPGLAQASTRIESMSRSFSGPCRWRADASLQRASRQLANL
jgi:hypothetical protein